MFAAIRFLVPVGLVVLAAVAPARAASGRLAPPDGLQTVVFQYGTPHRWRQFTYADAAEHDVWVEAQFALWDDASYPEYRGCIDSLHAYNPDLLVLAYQRVMGIYDYQVQGVRQGKYRSGWHHDAVVALGPYLAYTVEGDTFAVWGDNWSTNPLLPGCNEATVDLMERYWRRSSNGPELARGHEALGLEPGQNRLGVFWDFFPWRLPEWSQYRNVDLDRDGVPQQDDPDEQAALRAKFRELVLLVRERFGDDFVQVGNGSLSREDPEFAALLDGCLIEGSGKWGFGDAQVANLLDPAYEYSLVQLRDRFRTVNGGPYVLIDNLQQPDRAVAISLLFDWVYGAHNPPGKRRYIPPMPEFDLGPPLEDYRRSGRVYTRRFADGVFRLEVTSGRYPDPFTISITAP